MPISLDHAFSRGMVSPAARNRALSRSKGSASMGPKGKMVPMMQNNVVDEHFAKRGQVPKNEINARAHQKTARVAGQTLGVPGSAGKGGYKSAGPQPTRSAINENTGKKFPAGAKVKRGNARYKNRGNSGGSDANRGGDGQNYYGGPNSNER